MKRSLFLSLCLPVAGLFVVSLVGSASTPQIPDTPQVQTKSFAASAYGTTAFVGSTITSGKTALVSIGSGCGTTKQGAHASATFLSVTDPPAITTAVIDTSAASGTNYGSATSDVHAINLLGGLITATEVKAVSVTQFTTGFHVSGSSSSFLNLVVAGNSISGTPAPNTTILLPGIGEVVLNEQRSYIQATQAGLTVNMIHVYVNVANNLNIPVGTQIIIADAVSGMAVVNGPAILDGSAYGTLVASNLVNSSPTARVYMPCQGTGGAVITDSVVGVNVPNVLSAGTITDTAQGTVTQSGSNGETTSTVLTTNLLSSLVTANSIKADAHASTTDGTNFSFSDSGSSFVNLKVSGFPGVTGNANTVLAIAGVGTLYLHRVITTSNNIEVRMIELVVDQKNTYGLAIGADIRVGVAYASLHSAAKP